MTKIAQAMQTRQAAAPANVAPKQSIQVMLNSLLVLPGASARNVARNLRQYHLFSILFALIAGIAGLVVSYFLGTSAGAAISLGLALIFAISFLFRKARS